MRATDRPTPPCPILHAATANPETASACTRPYARRAGQAAGQRALRPPRRPRRGLAGPQGGGAHCHPRAPSSAAGPTARTRTTTSTAAAPPWSPGPGPSKSGSAGCSSGGEVRVDANAVTVGLLPEVEPPSWLPAEPRRCHLGALTVDGGDDIAEVTRHPRVQPVEEIPAHHDLKPVVSMVRRASRRHAVASTSRPNCTSGGVKRPGRPPPTAGRARGNRPYGHLSVPFGATLRATAARHGACDSRSPTMSECRLPAKPAHDAPVFRIAHSLGRGRMDSRWCPLRRH